MRFSAPALLAFIVSIGFAASPKLIPIYFSVIAPEKIEIIGDLSEYKLETTTEGKLRTETYEFAVKNTTLNSVGLGSFLYGYSAECIQSNGAAVNLGQSIFKDLQSNLNKYVSLPLTGKYCEKIRVVAKGPLAAVRLHSADAPILVSEPEISARIEWLTEFFVVSTPIFLAFIFFGLIILNNLTNVFNFGAGSNLIKYSLSAYSLYFVLQAGFFTKLIPGFLSGNLTSKLNAFTALYALGLGIVGLTYSPRVGKLLGKLPEFKIIAGLALICSMVFLTARHRDFFVAGYGITGAVLVTMGIRKRTTAMLFLGLAVTLDSLKMYNIATPFISRVSWFYVSFVMIIDSGLRLYGLGRIFSVFRKIENLSDTAFSDLKSNLEAVAKVIKDELHLSSIRFNFVTDLKNDDDKNHSSYNFQVALGDSQEIESGKNLELSLNINRETLGTLSLGTSFLYGSDLPSSWAIRKSIESELTSRAPSLFGNIFSSGVRKLENYIDQIESEIQVDASVRDLAIEHLLSKISSEFKFRIVLGDYIPVTHQVKVRLIRGFPQRVEERWLRGFLRATPDSQYGPLARGIHGKSTYIVPNTKVIEPFIHENTVEYYREAKTISCFAVPIFNRSVDGSVIGVLYGESSDINFDEGYRSVFERLARLIERTLENYRDRQEIRAATSALSRFIPRTHVFALINGSQITERDRGYLLMIDLKSSTKFSLEHGSDAWLERVETLQSKMRPIVESCGMTLQTFSWDAAFITLSSACHSIDQFEKVERVSNQLALAIEEWASRDKLLTALWSTDNQKARFCLTFGDTSRGLASGTTETWTVTGESMAVIAKMEAECKTLSGVFFTDLGIESSLTDRGFSPTNRIIRSVGREILSLKGNWSEFLVDTATSNVQKKVA